MVNEGNKEAKDTREGTNGKKNTKIKKRREMHTVVPGLGPSRREVVMPIDRSLSKSP